MTSTALPREQAQPENNPEKMWISQGQLSVLTLAEREWRAAAPGQKPLRLPHATS